MVAEHREVVNGDQRRAPALRARWLSYPAVPADVARCAELIDQYADSDIGFVDASIVAVAERLAITHILTLDRRHFGMLRPRHCSYFTLVPA